MLTLLRGQTPTTHRLRAHALTVLEIALLLVLLLTGY
jgi:hypothetical protein